MRDLSSPIRNWLRDGQAVAVATVVRVWGSAPRRPGARLAVSSTGEFVGSVSGGCVEGDVVREAQEVLAGGVPRLLSYTVSHDDAYRVGLSCGGTIEIFVDRADETFAALSRSVDEERLVALATVIQGPGIGRKWLFWPDGGTFGDPSSPALLASIRRELPQLFQSFGQCRREAVDDGAALALFVETFPPQPRLFIVGAVHVALPLVRMARTLGFHSIVIDPRSAFASPERFAEADELSTDWPQQAMRGRLNEASCVVVLTHDLKIDVPALQVALQSPARYVGVLGSRKTHERRVKKLEQAGVGLEQIERLHAPVGLDLGGREPAEIALAILAEIVASRHGKFGAKSPGSR